MRGFRLPIRRSTATIGGVTSRVVFNTASTLNGFLADDQDSLDWLFAVPGAEAAEAGMADFMTSVGVLVMGSTTYEWLVDHERLLEHPEAWPYEQPAFVFSSRAQPAVPGADVRVVHGPVVAVWPDIATAADGGVVWLIGGGDLVGQFDDAGLLDEIRVSVAPATLATGRPLLPRRIGPDRLELTSVERAGQFVELTYAVRPAPPADPPERQIPPA